MANYDPWDDSETEPITRKNYHKRYDRKCPACKHILPLNVYDDEPIMCDYCGWMEQLSNDDY